MLYRKLITLESSTRLFLFFLFYFISSKLHEIIYVSLILLDIQHYSSNVHGTDCTNLYFLILSSSRMHHSSIYPSSSRFNCECTREKMCMFWYSIFEPNRILIYYLSNNLFSFNFKDIRVCDCKHVGILFEGFL